jgi:hypothetical protein
MVSLLSGQPLNWGQGLQKRVGGLQPGHAGSSFSKLPSKPLKIIFITLNLVRRGPRELLRILVFFQSDREPSVYEKYLRKPGLARFGL